MGMDPAERGGVELASEFCPVKGQILKALHGASRENFAP